MKTSKKEDRKFAGYYSKNKTYFQVWLDRPVYKHHLWHYEAYQVGEGFIVITQNFLSSLNKISRKTFESGIGGRVFVYDPFSFDFNSEDLNPLKIWRPSNKKLIVHLFENDFAFELNALDPLTHTIIPNTSLTLYDPQSMLKYIKEHELAIASPRLKKQRKGSIYKIELNRKLLTARKSAPIAP